MNQNIKIAVLGSTGKSGKYLIKQLSAQGFSFKVLLRHPEAFAQEHPSVEVVQGDARLYESVHKLIEGCDAVISSLGQPKGEPSIFSQASANVIKAMKEIGIRRYIMITGLNVDAPYDQKSAKTKAATDWMKANYTETTNDKQKEFELLSASGLDWTMVRLPMIDQTDEKPEIRISLEDCPGEKISATSLAHFLIGQLGDKMYYGKAPFIGNV